MATVRALRSAAGVTMSRGPDALPRHGEQAVDHLVGELGQAARVVRRRGHHVQRLEPEDRDEGLHGVVGEHATAAALAGAGVQRVPGARPRRPVGHLEGRHEVDAVAVSGSMPGLMGPSDRMTAGVSFSRTAARSRPGACRRRPRRPGPATPFAARWTSATSWTSSRPTRENRICGVPLSWPSETPSVNAGGISRTARSSSAMRRVQRRLDGLHLLRDAQVALAVAEVADDRPDRIVDLPDVLTEEAGRADPLHVAPGVDGHERAPIRPVTGVQLCGDRHPGRGSGVATGTAPGTDRA